jgi:hydrogenase maturation protein HypF
VATSGNLSDEPICIDSQDALQRLGEIADVFLVHDRPIVRHVDDSVARIVLGRELVLRRARGYAPFPIPLKLRVNQPPASPQPVVLALGAHLKNTVALARQGDAVLSQHIADLDNESSYAAFRRVVSDLIQLHETTPSVLAIDQHPDYLSSRFGAEFAPSLRPVETFSSKPIPGDGLFIKASAPTQGLPLVAVQHHLAHVFSCVAENEVELPVLGISWDGTGLGVDGAIWGGEFFDVAEDHSRRIAHFRSFPLPGGDQAIKEPRRIALGLLWEAYGDAAFDMTDLPTLQAFSSAELKSLRQMLRKRLNSPLTSSAGRLFDAVASLAGLRQHTRFEGEAAMELEFAAHGFSSEQCYEIQVLEPRLSTEAAPLILDWKRLVESVVSDLRDSVSVPYISARFHNALVEAIAVVAKLTGLRRVVLTGGCYQNMYLLEHAVRRLTAEGFQPYWHQRVPPNDGGISLGQVVAALRCAV